MINVEELLNHQYIVFQILDEKYALKILDIYEIIKLQKITTVSNTKSFLEGVINLRGKIVPIVNVHKRFGIPSYKISKSTRIVVVKPRDEMIGIIVDGVNQVVKFKDVQPSLDIVSGIEGTYFEGMGVTSEGVVNIMNIDKVLYEE